MKCIYKGPSTSCSTTGVSASLQACKGFLRGSQPQTFAGFPRTFAAFPKTFAAFPKTFAAWLGGTRWSAKVRGKAAMVREKAAKVREEAAKVWGDPAKVWGWDSPRKPLQACRLAAFSDRPAGPARDQRGQQSSAEYSRTLAPQHTKAPPALSAV